MKVIVDWSLQGAAEVEAKDIPEAEKLLQEKLENLISDNKDVLNSIGASSVQGTGREK